jgi:hypothetical protein
VSSAGGEGAWSFFIPLRTSCWRYELDEEGFAIFTHNGEAVLHCLHIKHNVNWRAADVKEKIIYILRRERPHGNKSIFTRSVG